MRLTEWSEAEDRPVLRLGSMYKESLRYISPRLGKNVSFEAIRDRYAYLKANKWSEADNNLLLKLRDDEKQSFRDIAKRFRETGKHMRCEQFKKHYHQLKQDWLLLKYIDEGVSFEDIALRIGEETGQLLTGLAAKKRYLVLRWLPI
jgi:hypothetical protein